MTSLFDIETSANPAPIAQQNFEALDRSIYALRASASLNFPSISGTGGQQDLTITVTGAAAGDFVVLSLPASPTAGLLFNAWVSAPDIVTVRATNCTGSSIDPGALTFKVWVVPN